MLVVGAVAACGDDGEEPVVGSGSITDPTESGDELGDASTTEDPQGPPMTPVTIEEGSVPIEATGTGPVDADHPCGALSVDEVAALASEVVGAEIDGTTCYYVDVAGDDRLGVEVDDAAGAGEAEDEFAATVREFDPSFDATGAGCRPVDLADEAAWCTRANVNDAPSLVVRAGATVIELLGFDVSDVHGLTDLAELAVGRL